MLTNFNSNRRQCNALFPQRHTRHTRVEVAMPRYIYMNSIYTEEGGKMRSGDEVAEVVVGAVGAVEGCYDTILGKINR